MLALLIGTSVSPRWLFVEPATNEPGNYTRTPGELHESSHRIAMEMIKTVDLPELIARSPPGRKVGEPSAPHSVAVLALAGDSRP